MSTGFPQYSPSAKQGNIGVGMVSRIVEDSFGWLFRRNHQENDFGIDGQIEVVTEAGAVTGQMLAVQIKCGPSFFRDSNQLGYLYRGETKHFNYLANYPLPVIIVICDPQAKEAYWARFEPGEARITEAGWKLTIPRENRLLESKAAIEALLPTVSDHWSALVDYWRVHNMLLGYESFVFMISHGEVESEDISGVNVLRARLTSTKELALHCQGKVEFSFSGYDEDPRELYEIDEVMRYIAALDAAFPELFFFVRTEEPMVTLKLFMYALFGVGFQGEAPNRTVILDMHLSGRFLSSHFEGLNLISEWAGLSEEEIYRISKAVMLLLGFPPASTTRPVG
ncbi:MAG: DUF4365 and DUF1817 domain-containing protein [Acidobacteriota bacterium]